MQSTNIQARNSPGPRDEDSSSAVPKMLNTAPIRNTAVAPNPPMPSQRGSSRVLSSASAVALVKAVTAKTKNIITAVMHKREDGWEIFAFHNAPVQKQEGEETGFVIHIQGVDTGQGGKAMIKDVPLIGVFVNDQEAALDFYANKLGLEKVQYEAYGPSSPWSKAFSTFVREEWRFAGSG